MIRARSSGTRRRRATRRGERVPDAVPSDRGEDTERDGDDERQEQRAARQLERRAEAVENQAEDGIAGLEGAPEVARERGQHPARGLGGERAIQAESLAYLAATSCENSPPISTASGPPGASRISVKRMTETPTSIRPANPSRFAM